MSNLSSQQFNGYEPKHAGEPDLRDGTQVPVYSPTHKSYLRGDPYHTGQKGNPPYHSRWPNTIF